MLNSEPGRPSGDVVTGRKGGVFMASTVHGKAAHSGADPAGGTSAIGELAHKTIALHAVTDLERGTTVNVGLVSGGQSVNAIAPLATCAIDLRYVRPEDREAAMARIAAIVTEAMLPGTSAALTIRGYFLPLQDAASRALFEAYAGASARYGATVSGAFTSGCADSDFTASVGCPTLRAVGPVGGRAHSPEEYREVESLVPRARALAVTIMGAYRPRLSGRRSAGLDYPRSRWPRR